MERSVSICVPNLNTRPFLKERFDSIFNQTFQDWELFVYDSHSDDGAWEFIQDLAKKCHRMRIAQGPREGPYPAWNECLRRTSGEYVYIATSDDSMAPDFLEKMVPALDANRDCELAHSPVLVVDENGCEISDRVWPDNTMFAEGAPELVKVPHIRRAPYCGLLQLAGRQTVLSITQLLIRRSLFLRVGSFPNRWGSVSDLNWEMKAFLVANTVHVPDTWATWRSHSKQLTASQDLCSAAFRKTLDDMIEDALFSCEAYLPRDVRKSLQSHLLDTANEMRKYYSSLRDRRSVIQRRVFQMREMCLGSRSVRKEILRQFMRKPKWINNFPTEVRFWLESLGLQPLGCCALASENNRNENKAGNVAAR